MDPLLGPVEDDARREARSAVEDAVARGEAAPGLAAAAAAVADAHGARSPEAPRRACAPGCTPCCSFPVAATPVEALAVAAALARLPVAEHAAVVADVQARDAVQRREGWRELAAARRPCVLLDADGRCRVHPQRPLRCRAWNVADAQACHRERDGTLGAGETLPVDRTGFAVTLAAGEGRDAALAAAGLDVTPVELVAALARLLPAGDEDLSGHWRAGAGDVFAGVRRPGSPAPS